MIVVMAPEATSAQVKDVVARVKEVGLSGHIIEGEEQTIVGVVGVPLPPTLDEMMEVYPGVERVVRITSKFKLTSWHFHPQKTVIRVSESVIGGDAVTIIAGPCSVESAEQTIATAHAVKAAGATLL